MFENNVDVLCVTIITILSRVGPPRPDWGRGVRIHLRKDTILLEECVIFRAGKIDLSTNPRTLNDIQIILN